MREVVRGDKHNLRRSANRNAQISVIHSAHCTGFVLCNLQIFSGCVCHLEQPLHAQSPFLFPMVFSINLIPFFDICSVPGCSGIRGRNSCCLWFWQLVFGVSLRAATSNLPTSPNPLSNRSTLLFVLLFAGTIFCEFLRFGKNRKNKYPQKILPTHLTLWCMYNHKLRDVCHFGTCIIILFWSFLPFFTSFPCHHELAKVRRRSGQSVTASDFGSNGPRFESGRGRCVESLDKALYSHCPKEKPSH